MSESMVFDGPKQPAIIVFEVESDLAIVVIRMDNIVDVVGFA